MYSIVGMVTGCYQTKLIKLSDVEIRVVEIFQDGRPATASFRFGVPLEDKSLSWLEWKDGTYLPFDPPPLDKRLQSLPAVLVAAGRPQIQLIAFPLSPNHGDTDSA